MQEESTHKLSPNEINDIGELLKEASTAINTEIIISQWVNVPGIPVPIPLFGGKLEHYTNEYYERALQILSDQNQLGSEREHEVRFNLASYFGFKYQSEQALPHAERCLELKPQDARTRILLARLYRDIDRHQDSAREFYAAARLSGIGNPWQTTKYLGNGLRQQISR